MWVVRLVVVLGLALMVLLGVVTLRAESARLHYRMSLLDHEAEQAWNDLRAAELELARVRNPARIRERIMDLRAAASVATSIEAPVQ